MNIISKKDYRNIPLCYRNLTPSEKKRVDAFYKIGVEAVKKNVKDFCEANGFVNRGYSFDGDYTFHIETDATVGRVFKTKTNIPLGYCSYNERKIVLNLDHVLLSENKDVIDTILHECAHAVAARLYNDYGHGKYWKKVSRLFGSSHMAKSSVNDAYAEKLERSKKWKLVALIPETKKVIESGSYNRRLKNLSMRYLRNDPTGTRGKLWHIPMNVYLANKNNYEVLAKHAVR